MNTFSAFADVFELSIEDLLNVEVSVASKNETPLYLSPGNVTSFSKQEFNLYGINTITDAVNLTSGYSTFYGLGERTLITRGRKISGFDNNHHLLKIDGVPFNHVRAGRVFLEEEIPLYNFQSIEVLKGPASAIYGTGALSGVISLNSKINNNEDFEIQAGIGSQNSKRIGTNFQRRLTSGKLFFSSSFYTQEASNDLVGDRAQDWRNRDSKETLFINSYYTIDTGALKGFTPGLRVAKKTSGMGAGFFGSAAGESEINEINWSIVSPYIKYQNQIFSGVELNSYVVMNESVEHSVFGNRTEDSTSRYKIAYREYELYTDLNKKSEYGDFTLGFDFKNNYRRGSPNSYSYTGKLTTASENLLGDSDRLNVYSAFLEYAKKLDYFEGIYLTLGVREDHTKALDTSFEQLSPRASMVMDFGNHQLKFLYSKAMRAPNLKNLLINKDAIKERKDEGKSSSEIPTSIDAEKLENFEIAHSSKIGQFMCKEAIFINYLTDEITREKRNEKDVYLNKTGLSKAYGYEIEFLYTAEKFNFGFNYSYSLARYNTDSGTVDQDGVPNETVSFRTSVIPLERVKLSLTGLYINQFRTNTDNKRYAGGLVLNSKLIYEYGSNNNLALEVTNLFDKKIANPLNGVLADTNPGRRIEVLWSIGI
ncbi:TonB-dependent receptor plug domain protein [Bacteriovorax sp. Seq25_V]|nr:TonB-dependent receptor plug domain protein [Bacteriovorax sp. Seq25_V]